MSEKIFSGERFMPQMNDPELEIEHLQRYYTVQDLVEGLDVLDAACGEGYGSSILAVKANSVVGIDIDTQTVLNAQKKYGELSNLQYLQGSIADLNMIETASKDAIISFETIEHVDRELQDLFLKEIRRILKPSGFLVMSTPDKKEYSDRYQFNNEFHVAEFYVDEFIAFLNKEFTNVKLFNQYLEVASFIDQSDVEDEHVLYVKDVNKYNPVGKYVIAVASNTELPSKSLSSVFMHHRETYLPTLDELNYCRREAIICREKATKLDACLNDNKLQAEELDRRAEELEKRMTLINTMQGTIDILKNENKLQKEEMQRRAEELEKRMALINTMQQELNVLGHEKEIQKEEMQRRAEELEKRMALINTMQQELNVLGHEKEIQKEEMQRREEELKKQLMQNSMMQEQIKTLESDRQKLEDELRELHSKKLVKYFVRKK